jgi:hypothetical protein
MNNTSKPNYSSPYAARLLVLWLALLGLSCDAANDAISTEEDSASEESLPDSVRERSDGQSSVEDLEYGTEKALRKDFCCVLKSGNTARECIGMNRTKVWAATKCSFGGGTSSVLRDGKCSKYSDCEGREGPCSIDTPNGIERVPCNI